MQKINQFFKRLFGRKSIKIDPNLHLMLEYLSNETSMTIDETHKQLIAIGVGVLVSQRKGDEYLFMTMIHHEMQTRPELNRMAQRLERFYNKGQQTAKNERKNNSNTNKNTTV